MSPRAWSIGLMLSLILWAALSFFVLWLGLR